MTEITVNDLARNLSEVLEAVEHRRESFRITRDGRAIARVSPDEAARGRDVKDLLARHRVDPAWGADLAQLRASVQPQGGSSAQRDR